MSANKKPPTAPVSGADPVRNEYIPAFISKRPFWAETTHSTDTDYLEHQRLQSAPQDTLAQAKWYERGKKLGPAATKFRKGACENCGAMTHKTKECLSRPRKQGARWTGRDIQADEVVEDLALGWDAKRDRWNGYDSREYGAVVREYEELDAIKRAAAAGENKDIDDARIAEETDMGRNQPLSTRQLRLREDTAVYLRNLDLESAHYDPKTRSMDKTADAAAAAAANDGDVSEGFTRPADDADEFARAERYAWEAQGHDAAEAKRLHLQANPTEGEMMRKTQARQSTERKAASRQALLDKYGADAARPAPKSAAQAVVANERYVEYDAHGQIKGRGVARSKYAEDVRTNNHAAVWGSWWRDFAWGYACCHSTVKNSYCTGTEGRRAWEESEGLRTGETLQLQIEDGGGDSKDAVGDDGQRQDGDGDSETQSAATAEIKSRPPPEERPAKKRTLQELQSGISEEELESYKRNRVAADDPMAGMLGRDELVEMK